jgi:hypothetical protein
MTQITGSNKSTHDMMQMKRMLNDLYLERSLAVSVESESSCRLLGGDSQGSLVLPGTILSASGVDFITRNV